MIWLHKVISWRALSKTYRSAKKERFKTIQTKGSKRKNQSEYGGMRICIVKTMCCDYQYVVQLISMCNKSKEKRQT